MKELNLESTVELNNGVKIPLLGLGTYLATGDVCYRAVREAIKVGYRHIDTASMYDNEEKVGKAVRDCDESREDIFITTKLWNSDHGYEQTKAAFEASLERLDLEYIDLYLIHWPVQELRLDSWKAMEELYKEGRCRAIGVSNYMDWHIDELLKVAKVVPVVNQIEFHPWLYLKDLQKYCMDKNIWIQAYSPLTKGRMLNDPPLKEIALKYNVSTSQILIRWCLQNDTIVLPKSADIYHIMENAEVYDFKITEEDMEALDAFHRNMRVTWDPTTQP
ncbi:MAG: aldo/keto reductase [Asgard group archaeon]|nr:aldo/keto reductase [Asgard group archaeon]